MALLTHQLADKFADVGANNSESSENDKLQLSWVERRAWLVQKRLLAAASIAINQGPKRMHAKIKRPKVSRINDDDRVDDLEKLGHSICFGGGSGGADPASGKPAKQG